MATKRLKRIEMDSQIRDRLIYHNLTTCKDVLATTPFDLVKLLNVGYPSVQRLIAAVSRACAPQSTTALDLIQRRPKLERFLPTSLDQVDNILQGGLATGTITEVAGPSGCGKTQFCIMISVVASHQAGSDGGVLYIDTESAIFAHRFVEVAQSKFPSDYSTDESLENLASRIHIVRESTCESLLYRLENLEEFLISRRIKFLVIDSIASLIRKEFDSRSGKNMIARTNMLSRKAAILKKLAEDFSIAVLVTNQITTRYESSADSNLTDDSHNQPDPGYVTVALGNTWSHCVNTRLILQYLDGPWRQLLIAKSPVAPFANFIYSIQASGFIIQSDSGHHYEGTDPGLQKIRVRTSLPQDAFSY